MSACEKCWRDSRREDNYEEVLMARKDFPCTAEEQAGPDATVCEACERRTRHQYTRQCMACGADATGVLR